MIHFQKPAFFAGPRQHSGFPPAGNRIVSDAWNLENAMMVWPVKFSDWVLVSGFWSLRRSPASQNGPDSPLDTRQLRGQLVMKQFITTQPDGNPQPTQAMQTLTVRDLRYDFGKVEAWLAFGEEIEITKHGKPVARLSLPSSSKPPKFDIDVHRKRMKETWGDRVFSAEEVREMREAELGDRS